MAAIRDERRPTVAPDAVADAGLEQVPADPRTPTESAPDERDRVGYGRYARYSPVGIALLVVVALLVIGATQRQPGSPSGSIARLIGQPAPEVELTLLDGSTFWLGDLTGSVVVVNFWASWCAPCKSELPRLQAVSDEAARTGQAVTVVGVGIKRDYDGNARDQVAELGLTFPIGRDTAGDDPVRGPIEAAFGVTNYPTTVFIRPDGTVSAVHIGELQLEQIRAYVEAAKR